MATQILSARNGACGIYTFTFDDGAIGQFQNAATVLAEHGLRGSFFLIGRTVNDSRNHPERFHVPQMLAAQAMGHEIGSHTYTHTTPLSELDEDGQRKEIADNQSYLAKWGVKAMSFAYPFDKYNATTLSIIPEYARFARRVGTRFVLNSLEWDEASRYAVKCSSSDCGRAIVETAIAEGKWCVGIFHEISATGKNNATVFAEFAEWISEKVSTNELWVDTFSEVMQYAQLRAASTVTESRPSADLVRVSLKTDLSTDFPVNLTLKTDTGGRHVSRVTQAWMNLQFVDDGVGVMYNAIPNGGSVDIMFHA